MKVERLTVKKLKEILKAYKVPDDALITCQSDEEGNRDTVCCDVFVDKVGLEHKMKYGDKEYIFVGGEDVIGFEQEDKGKIFITFRPMY